MLMFMSVADADDDCCCICGDGGTLYGCDKCSEWFCIECLDGLYIPHDTAEAGESWFCGIVCPPMHPFLEEMRVRIAAHRENSIFAEFNALPVEPNPEDANAADDDKAFDSIYSILSELHEELFKTDNMLGDEWQSIREAIAQEMIESGGDLRYSYMRHHDAAVAALAHYGIRLLSVEPARMRLPRCAVS